MSLVRRAARLVAAAIASYAVRVLARLRPQRWCPPSITLRLFRLSSAPGTAIVASDLRAHLPEGGRGVRTDLSYGPGPSDRFDLVLPPGPGPHPLVLWVHGGGWHFGDKSDVVPYLEHLAVRAGVAGAAVNYPLAPRHPHPVQLDHVRAALEHLVAHAEELGIDPARVVLAGDSAGAQVAAELAAELTAEPAAVGTGRLCGAVFFCGIFEPSGLDDSNRMFEAALESAMWSLARTRSWQSGTTCARMTVTDHVTPAFPPTFLGAGEQDPLTRRQTPPMAQALRRAGVRVVEHRAGTESEPCHHQFQFWLGTPAAQEALEAASGFLREVTSISH
ncbi:MAG: alpha/beta hydrolase [Marmoricola sp.]